VKKDVLRLALLAVIIFVVAAVAVWEVAFRAVTPEYEGRLPVNLHPDINVEEVAGRLEEAGILKKTGGFLLLARVTGWGDQIKAGHYEIASGVSNRDILDILRRGLQEPVRVYIPAGTRKERMIRSMAAEMAFTEEELTSVLSDTALARELATDTTHLWAFMIPDTYHFYWLTPPEDVVRRVKTRYDRLVQSAVDSMGVLPLNLSADEVVRMAGIVEWETAHVPEKPTVAGVYMNRIRDGWRLDADPTVQYAIMKIEGNKRRLFFRDYDLNHAYNTYRRRGLPPGPITNPSASSIQAVLYPETHRYYFFVATGEGTHIFSRTLAEHRRNAQNYYRVMRERRAAEAAAKAAAEAAATTED
jgi:UPF0755 protein